MTRYDALGSVPATSDQLVTNIDVAPTFADLGGVSTPSFVEGKSIMPLLDGTSTGWRNDYLMEHAGNVGIVPPYCGVHTQRWVYVEYGANKYETAGFEELYDLSSDPYELTNLLKTNPSDPVVQQQRDALHDRMLQLCNPPPPGFAP